MKLFIYGLHVISKGAELLIACPKAELEGPQSNPLSKILPTFVYQPRNPNSSDRELKDSLANHGRGSIYGIGGEDDEAVTFGAWFEPNSVDRS